MRKTNPEFIIRIIVRARNEIAGVLEKAAADVDKLTKSQERGTKAEKNRADATHATAKEVEAASKRFDNYVKEVEKGTKAGEVAEKQLRSFQREFDKLGNRTKAGSDVADSIYKISQQAKNLSDNIKKENAKQAASDVRRAREAEQASKAVAAARKAEADNLVADVNRELKADADRAKQFDANMKREEAAYRRRIETIQKGREEFERAQKSESDAVARAVEDQVKGLEERAIAEQRVRAEIAKTMRVQQMARTQAERDVARSTLSGHVQDLRDLGVPEKDVRRTITTSYKDLNDGDVQVSKRQREIRDLADDQRRLFNMPAPAQSALSRFLHIDQDRLDAINGHIREFQNQSNKAGFSAVRLAGNLRGMVIVGAIGFFQQLVGVGVSLAGSLVSIASTAVQAGAALGGALAAGAAQAIPVVGLLAAAWGRVGAVFDAVKQAQKARAASAYDDATAADKQRSAADTLRSAQEALSNAHRQATDAQEGLTKARQDAVRQIQDLVAAERSAELQAESAALAQSDAQEKFKRALATGDVSNIASDALGVRQANAQVLDSGVAAARAKFDARKAVAGGVEGMDNVVAARRAVADANRSIADAQRGLASAGQTAGEAVRQTATADRLLAQLLGQLSPAERRLYVVLEAVRKRYRQVFTGPGGVLESIIDAFTYGGQKALELLNNPQIISAARVLAQTIGGQIRRIFDFISSPGQVSFLMDMARLARQNLPIVVTLLEQVVVLFENIARAGAPAFRAFLDFLSQAAGKADKATGSGSGLQRLTAFFSQGEKYAESILRLAGAIAGLFLAIIGSSAKEGNNAIDDLTAKIHEATDWIDKHQDSVRQFFAQVRESTAVVMSTLFDMVKLLFGLYNAGQVEAFARAWSKTLLPALTDVLRVMGFISHLFLVIMGTGVGSGIFRFLLAMVGIRAAAVPVISLFGKLAVGLGTLFGRVGLVTRALGFLKIASGPWGYALSAIAGVFLVLSGNVNSFGDAIKKLIPIVAGLTAVLFARSGLGGGLALIGNALSKIPGLGRLGGRAATTAAETALPATIDLAEVGVAGKAGTVAAEGAKAGKIFGGAAKLGIAGMLKVSVWATLGVGAAEGIISGFKHHSVRAGFQDFFHTVSFGLIDSVDQAGTKAAIRLAAKLRGAVGDNLDTVGTGKGGKGRPFDAEAALGPLKHTVTIHTARGGNTQVSGVDTEVGDQIKSLEADYGKSRTQTFFDNLSKGADRVRAAFKSRNYLGLESLVTQLENFRSAAPGKLGSAFDDLIQEAKTKRDELQGVFNQKLEVTNLVGDFGVALQGKNAEKNLDKIVGSLEEGMKKLPPALQKKARDSSIAMAQGLADKGILSQKAADKIKSEVRDSYDQMHNHAAKQATKTASDTAKALAAAANVVTIEMGGMIQSVNGVLKDLGFGKIKIPTITPQSAKNGAGDIGGLLGVLLGGNASGGFVGQKGERGGDVVPRLLGRGEAVLNWAHQRVVEPAMRAYYGTGLNEMFQRVRGKHGAEATGGLAGGGFAADPGKNFSYGQEPKIAAALDRLGKKLGVVVEGISGYRSPSYSVSVGGFADDPHTRGQAADIGVPGGFLNSPRAEAILRSVGLYRPFYPASAKEINHVQLLAGAAKNIKGIIAGVAGATAAAYKKIKAPNIPGDGPLSKIMEGMLKRVARAGNKKMQGSADAGGAGGPDLGGFTGGGSTAANRRLGQRMFNKAKSWVGGTFSMMDAIIRPESGWDETVHYGGGHGYVPGLAYGIPQALPGNKMASRAQGGGPKWLTDAATQISWFLHYVKSAYGGLPQAYAHRQAAGTYERGGGIPGSGPKSIIAHGGEHVLTAAEVARAGGHNVIYAMRKMLGGGKQSRSGAYRDGGQIAGIASSYDEGSIGSDLNRAQKLIAGLKTSTISKKFTDKLSNAFNDLTGDGGIFDQLNDAVTFYSDRLAANLKRATYKVTTSLSGAIKATKRLSDVQVATRTVSNLEKVYGALNDEQDRIQSSLEDVHKRLKDKHISSREKKYLEDVRVNLTKRLHDVQSSLADTTESLYQAAGDKVNAIADRVNNKADRATSVLSLQDRVNSALGIKGASTAAGRTNVIKDQISGLQRAAAQAAQSGRGDLAQKLKDQIADLQTSIVEIAAQSLSDSVDVINNAASRREAGFGLRNRLADLMQSAGNAQGAFAQRGQVLQDRSASLQQQRDGLNNLLTQAALQGNQGQVDSLTDQIAELDVTVAENNAAIKENTIAARQAAIDAINSRGQFQGGVFGGLQQLLVSLSTQTGTNTTEGQKSLIGLVINTLRQTGSGLADQLFQGFGIDLRNLSPGDLVKALSNLNYDGIEANFTDSQKQQFEDLITAIITNATSLSENTTQLNQLNGNTGQSFTSSAWSFFRRAIFDGNNNLLPQYAATVPGSSYASNMTLSGSPALHTMVSGGGVSPGGSGGETHIYEITTPVEVLSGTTLARETSWARSHSPRGSEP